MADDVCFPVTLCQSAYTPTTGRPFYTQIVASQDRVYDAVKFFITGNSMTSFFMAIYKPTAANTLTRVMDLGNVKASINAGVGLQTFNLPGLIDAKAGEIFYVGFLCVGGTMPTFARAGTIGQVISGVTMTTGLVPEYQQLTAVGSADSQTSLGSSMTMSSTFATNAAARAWAALGTNITLPTMPFLFPESYNRINTPALALPWASRTDTSHFGIYNETASPQVSVNPAFNYLVPSMKSDDHYVQFKLASDMTTEAGTNINGYVGLRAQANGGAGPCVKVHINPSDGTFRIVTVTNGATNAGITQRATYTPPDGFVLGDLIKLVADSTVYTVFFNDTPVMSWTDSGAIQPVGANYRNVNKMTSATSTADLQIFDDFECGDFGGGVQLIGVPLGAADNTVFPITVQNDVFITPSTPAVFEIIGGTSLIIPDATAVVGAPAAELSFVNDELPATFPFTFGSTTPRVEVIEHPIQFDAVGAGGHDDRSSSLPISTSFSHLTGTEANRILLAFAVVNSNGTNVFSSNPTYNGIAMTHISSPFIGSTGKRLRMWVLMNPASGLHTVAWTQSTDGTNRAGALRTVSYSGVASYHYIGSYSNSGSGTSRATPAIPSDTLTELVVAACGDLTSTAMSSFVGATLRGTEVHNGSVLNASLAIADTYGRTATNISAAGAFSAWAAGAIRLIGA